MKLNHRKTRPFLFLTIIHTSLFIYTLLTSRDKAKVITLLLSNISFAYLFEYIVLSIFKAYRYSPKIFKNPHLDNILGAIFSQAIFVPFTSTFISEKKLGWKVKMLFGLYFSLAERVFIHKGIHRNRWWRTLYTFILIPVNFSISDFWYRHIKKETSLVLNISLFNSIFITGLNLLFIMAVKGKYRFGVGTHVTWREHFILVPAYSFVRCVLFTFLIKKNGNWSKVILIVFSIVLDFLLWKLKIVKFNIDKYWKTLFFHLSVLVLAIQYKKIIFR